MNKEESDKITKLANDVKEISERIEKLSIVGNKKEIVKFGNSAEGVFRVWNSEESDKTLVVIAYSFS